jgi:ABC-type uncharacterized transport system ATPase subunit
MSDVVFMMDAGKLVLQGELDELKDRHQHLVVQFPEERRALPKIDGVLSARRHGAVWSVVCNGAKESISALLDASGGQILESRCATLQEIFVARAGRQQSTCKVS